MRPLPKSRRGCVRAYNAIIRQCYSDAVGGCEYGIDWPTLLVLWPDRAARIKAIKALYKVLP